MDQYILECIKYYAVQGKALTERELWLYMTFGTTKEHLRGELTRLANMGMIVLGDGRYTLSTYTQNLTHGIQRDICTREKLQLTAPFLKILKRIPWVECICLTGSCGISNAVAEDDIDLMLLTSEKRLFTTRLTVMLIATVMGVRRKRGVVQDPNAVCMNLWLDASDLSVPVVKRSRYAAREIAQMQMLYERSEGSLGRFVLENRWIEEQLPNLYQEYVDKKSSSFVPVHKPNMILDLIETLAKKIQLKYIKMHQTTELITETQLWFHPLDRSHLS
ncbi:MAG: hypothetical protein WCJ70_04710 [bacterium]